MKNEHTISLNKEITNKKVIALIDCNNFYASCERIFQPKLIEKPIVVLSNNDGCIIARSEEAKQFDIPMGIPYHKVKHIIEANNIQVFSSNYTLYGDISNRVMNTLINICQNIDIYSIDEAFLELKKYNKNIFQQGIYIKKQVSKCVGIPVSVGIAPTKTLAKLANKIAKENNREIGVFSLMEENEQINALKNLPVEKIWGIGKGFGKKLNSLGIISALQLRNTPSNFIKKHLGVVIERIIYELKGIPCIDMDHIPEINAEKKEKKRKSIICSRSFGRRITNYKDIVQTVATRTTKGAEKLRSQGLFANQIGVFLQTNIYNEHDQQHNKTTMITMPFPTNDTSVLIKYALICLKKIFEKGYHYHKSGIYLDALENKSYNQKTLFDPRSIKDTKKSDKLMIAMDQINKKFGQHSLQIAICGTPKEQKIWSIKQNHHSPHWTTKWRDLPTVKAI